MDNFNILETLEKQGAFIDCSVEHYKDGSNVNFSISFYIDGKQTNTGWYNDNHEFGNSTQVMNAAVKLAQWYLEKPERITMINTGPTIEGYFEYNDELMEFIEQLEIKNYE